MLNGKATLKHYSHMQITSYGIDERDEVHELEFLSLLAFLAREAISLKGIGVGFSKAKKFSPGDLQMAYAFHNKFGKGSTTQQPWSDPGNMGTQQQQISPSHISPSHRPPPAQHYQLNTSPQHAPGGLGQQGHQQDRLSSSGQGYAGQFPSPTTVARDYQGFSESYGGHMMQQQQPAEMAGQRLNQSARYSGQGMQFGAAGRQTLQDEQRMSMLGQGDRQSRPVSYLPQGLVEQERKTMSSTMQLYPGPMGSGGGQDMQFSPLGPMLDAGRSSGEKERGERGGEGEREGRREKGRGRGGRGREGGKEGGRRRGGKEGEGGREEERGRERREREGGRQKGREEGGRGIEGLKEGDNKRGRGSREII